MKTKRKQEEHNRQTRTEVTIHYGSNEQEPLEKTYAFDDVEVLTGGVGNPSPIWLYFRDATIVLLVRADLEAHEYWDRGKCLQSYPCHIHYRYPDASVVRQDQEDIITFSDGMRLSPSWDLCVIPFDPALRNTELLWSPLEEEHVFFSVEEMRKIRAIAGRTTSTSVQNAPCFCGWFHDGNERDRLTSWRAPEPDDRRFTFRTDSAAFKLLLGVHEAMNKGSKDCDTSFCEAFPSEAIRNTDARNALIAPTGSRRMRIRRPEETTPESVPKPTSARKVQEKRKGKGQRKSR